jgi:hypothetical protein
MSWRSLDAAKIGPYRPQDRARTRARGTNIREAIGTITSRSFGAISTARNSFVE